MTAISSKYAIGKKNIAAVDFRKYRIKKLTKRLLVASSTESKNITNSSNLPKLCFVWLYRQQLFVGGTAVDTVTVVGDKKK